MPLGGTVWDEMIIHITHEVHAWWAERGVEALEVCSQLQERAVALVLANDTYPVRIVLDDAILRPCRPKRRGSHSRLT